MHSVDSALLSWCPRSHLPRRCITLHSSCRCTSFDRYLLGSDRYFSNPYFYPQAAALCCALIWHSVNQLPLRTLSKSSSSLRHKTFLFHCYQCACPANRCSALLDGSLPGIIVILLALRTPAELFPCVVKLLLWLRIHQFLGHANKLLPIFFLDAMVTVTKPSPHLLGVNVTDINGCFSTTQTFQSVMSSPLWVVASELQRSSFSAQASSCISAFMLTLTLFLSPRVHEGRYFVHCTAHGDKVRVCTKPKTH